MKALGTENMVIVHCGEEWVHSLPPSSKEMGKLLERNERIVSWLQPIGGSVEDQIPVWRMGTTFFRMSLRMMKSVWRHVRLRKGFVNREAALFGGEKLRIPKLLMLEKIRTQHRFNVMRMESQRVVENKQLHCASHKIFHVVNEILLPLRVHRLGRAVSFRREEGKEGVLVSKIRELAPDSLADRESFVSFMGRFYDAYFGVGESRNQQAV